MTLTLSRVPGHRDLRILVVVDLRGALACAGSRATGPFPAQRAVPLEREGRWMIGIQLVKNPVRQGLQSALGKGCQSLGVQWIRRQVHPRQRRGTVGGE